MNSRVTGEFPAERTVTGSFDIFFDMHLNKWLNKQSWGWWFETPSQPLWRHCNEGLISSACLYSSCNWSRLNKVSDNKTKWMDDSTCICWKYLPISHYGMYSPGPRDNEIRPSGWWIRSKHMLHRWKPIVNSVNIRCYHATAKLHIPHVWFVGYTVVTLPPDIWRRHDMETFSTLLALCTGNPPVNDG